MKHPFPRLNNPRIFRAHKRFHSESLCTYPPTPLLTHSLYHPYLSLCTHPTRISPTPPSKIIETSRSKIYLSIHHTQLNPPLPLERIFNPPRYAISHSPTPPIPSSFILYPSHHPPLSPQLTSSQSVQSSVSLPNASLVPFRIHVA